MSEPPRPATYADLEAVPVYVRLPSNQAEFELALMQEIALRHETIAHVISEQFRRADVTDRYGSRVGCFTHFAVPDACERLPKGIRSPLDGPFIRMNCIVRGDIDPQRRGRATAGSLLFHEAGRIVMLECYSEGDSWPEGHYEFEFLPAENREGQ